MAGKSGQIPVALQLYSVREESARDFAGTLQEVAAIGYEAVELAGYGGMGATNLRSLLDDLGVSAVSSHVGLRILRESLEGAIDDALALGCHYIICPWLPEAERGDADAYRRLAAELSALGRRCRERGIGFAYHNHDFEFVRLDGRLALDVLFEGTDAKAVRSELDMYWAYYAGIDPAEILRHLGPRCALVHLKDMVKDDSRTFAEVGEGRIDFAPVFAAAQEAGVEYYVVEQDACRRPALESVKISLNNLRSWGIAQ